MSGEEWKIQAKQGFADQRQIPQLKAIDVTEWDIKVYYWPAMTLAEKRLVSMGYAGNDVSTAHVAQLIARGRDENGRNLFREQEREDLMTRYDPTVIERISMVMMKDRETPSVDPENPEATDLERALKNS